MHTRRDFLSLSLAATAGLALPSSLHAETLSHPDGPYLRGQTLLDDLSHRTFKFFWETTDPKTGLVPDHYPTVRFSNVAGSGFALTAYPIGVERGWISRKAARERTLATLRFFWNAPQGPQSTGTAGYKGFFYQLLSFDTNTRVPNTGLSTIDTALLMAGVLFASQYYDGDDPEEAEIRDLANRLYERVDWKWFAPRSPSLALEWRPESGFVPWDWAGYNEGMILYILALGSPTHPVPIGAWDKWTAPYPGVWTYQYGHNLLGFAPLFGHQYSHVWIDFRNIRDKPMREANMDYFENSRRATLVQRAYAIENPHNWEGYGENLWGITASDGPGFCEYHWRGHRRAFRAYCARGAGGMNPFDDGTLAPTASLASLPFAPDEVSAVADTMVARFGSLVYGKYGFRDSFNLSFRWPSPVRHSVVHEQLGWFDRDYVSIDQGPIVAMIENQRSDFVWKHMRANASVRQGLQRAGFSGGWLGEG